MWELSVIVVVLVIMVFLYSRRDHFEDNNNIISLWPNRTWLRHLSPHDLFSRIEGYMDYNNKCPCGPKICQYRSGKMPTFNFNPVTYY